jgi:hypothetical protein
LIKWFQNIPTSKRITWVILFSYIGEIVFTSYAMYTKQIDLTSILTFTTPIVATVIGSYYLKSGAENVTSIKQSNNQEGEA